MLSWVFNPFQGSYFFALRSPHFDRMGVAPLLLRRLIRFTKNLLSSYVKSKNFCWLSICVPSYRTLLLRALYLLPYGSNYRSLTNLAALTLRQLHQRLFQPSTLRRSAFYRLSFVLITNCSVIKYTKQFQPSLFLFCFLFDKEPGIFSR